MPTRVLSLRSRVAVLVAIPLAVMVIFASVAAIGRFADVSRAHRAEQNADAAVDASSFALLLQIERGRTNQWAANPTDGNRALLDQSRAATDTALTGFGTAVQRLRGDAAGRFDAAVTDLAGLAELRTVADQGATTSSTVFAKYSTVIADVLSGTDLVMKGLDLTGDVAREGAALDAAAHAAESVAAEQGLLVAVLHRGSFVGTEYDEFVAYDARRQELARIYRQTLEGTTDADAIDVVLRHQMSGIIETARSQALASVAGTAINVDADIFFDDMTQLLNGFEGIRQQLATEIASDLHTQAGAAESARVFYLLVALLAGGGVVGALWLMNRWIRRPFDALIHEVNETARVRLPEAVAAAVDPNAAPYELYRISSEGGQELAALADAFNEAQLQVVTLASDQAAIRRNVGEIFANLGRRNQKLIARQLSFIDRLEKREQDPEILENLFRLDHLATRMRRNAESLLVLAGTETPRTWSAPVNVGDSVRAAVAEVEQYERAEIRSLQAAKLRGNIASNVSHLLAELIENGLNFSPPDSVVVINGRLRDDEYVISVIDAGIGIEEDERDGLNHRLATAGAADVAPSRYLGLFVVSRLAARHGIMVELLEGESGGTHARVTLPAELLVLEGAAEDRVAASAATSAAGKSSGNSNGSRSSGGSAGATSRKPESSKPESSKPVQANGEASPKSGSPAPKTDTTARQNGNGGAKQQLSARPTVTKSSVGGPTPTNRESRPTVAKQSSAPVAAPSPAVDEAKPAEPVAPADSESADGSKLRTRPKREKRGGPATTTVPARRSDSGPRAAASQQTSQNAAAGGGSAHEQNQEPQEPEVMSSGLRRRAPKQSLERTKPTGGDTAAEEPAPPAPKRDAGEVKNMLSSFRAAQSRAAQRDKSSDTNDDEVTA